MKRSLHTDRDNNDYILTYKSKGRDGEFARCILSCGMEFLEKSKIAVLSHHMKAPGSSVPYFGHNGLFWHLFLRSDVPEKQGCEFMEIIIYSVTPSNRYEKTSKKFFPT